MSKVDHERDMDPNPQRPGRQDAFNDAQDQPLPLGQSNTWQTSRPGTPVIAYLVGGIAVLTVAGAIVAGVLPRISTEKELLKEATFAKNAIRSQAVMTITAGPTAESLTLPANLTAIQEIPIYARIDGYLKERLVDIGDKVKKGQLLALIDAPEVDKQLDQAQADYGQAKAQMKSVMADLMTGKAAVANSKATVKKMEANLTFSNQQLRRYEELAEEGAISRELRDEKQRDLDADHASIDAAKADVAAKEAQVQSYQEKVSVANSAIASAKANLERVQSLASFKRVTAPSDGVITARNLDAGALISEGSNSNIKEIVRMGRTDVLRVLAAVPQSFYRHIKAGMPVQIHVDEMRHRKFEGTVTKISGGLDPTSRTMQVDVRIDNQLDLLKPGMYVTVEFSGRTAAACHKIAMAAAKAQALGPAAEAKARATVSDEAAKMIPAQALVVKPDGLYVYQVSPENTIKLSKVVVGRDFGKDLEIVEGVKVGDRILSDPDIDLKEGDKIEPIKASKG